MPLTVPKLEKSQGPKYLQLVRAITEQIQSGQLIPGERLSSERKMAKELDISPTTTIAAMNELRRRGLLVRRHGSGTFVAKKQLDSLGQMFRLGFFSTQTISSYSIKLISALWKYCMEKKCDFIPLQRFNEEIESTIAEFKIDGALIYSREDVPVDLPRRLRALGIPALLISSIQEEDAEFCIGYSNEHLVSEAVEYLNKLGHSQIGFLIHSCSARPNNLRIKAFFSAMWQQKLPLNPEWVLAKEFTDSELHEFLTAKSRPSALIIGNQTLLSRFYSVLDKTTVRIPEDLSVICLDEHNDTYKFTPGISCFRIDVEKFSRAGVEYLLAELRHEPLPLSQLSQFCNFEFVDIGSCRKNITHKV